MRKELLDRWNKLLLARINGNLLQPYETIDRMRQIMIDVPYVDLYAEWDDLCIQSFINATRHALYGIPIGLARSTSTWEVPDYFIGIIWQNSCFELLWLLSECNTYNRSMFLEWFGDKSFTIDIKAIEQLVGMSFAGQGVGGSLTEANMLREYRKDAGLGYKQREAASLYYKYGIEDHINPLMRISQIHFIGELLSIGEDSSLISEFATISSADVISLVLRLIDNWKWSLHRIQELLFPMGEFDALYETDEMFIIQAAMFRDLSFDEHASMNDILEVVIKEEVKAQ